MSGPEKAKAGDRAGGRSPRVAAVIGDPVRHSRSPAIHNAAFAEVGLMSCYCVLVLELGENDHFL